MPDGSLPRFTRGERWVHRSLGIVMGVLLVTGAFLFFPDLGGLIGNRQIVSLTHEISGWLLPIPLLLALLSRAFRVDAGRLNRFRPTDWEWLRSRDRRSGRIPVGKFNAGQKLNSSFTLGAIIVMFGTGMVMFFSSLFTDTIRTGATFVHDWLALALARRRPRPHLHGVQRPGRPARHAHRRRAGGLGAARARRLGRRARPMPRTRGVSIPSDWWAGC